MTFILLTGAGFSRNWGGWLANEAFEYLLGSPEIDDPVRQMLWNSKDKGGFELALANLQQKAARDPEGIIQLKALLAALVGMFNHMNEAFKSIPFEPQNDARYLIKEFLARFDAIFTLNQDLLLESRYLDANIALCQNQKWNGWQIPGMKPIESASHFGGNFEAVQKQSPDASSFHEKSRLQPYYKLHGSINWVSPQTDNPYLVVLGGAKSAYINQHDILVWYRDQFNKYLRMPAAQLMVIGYSFSDEHINESICAAASAGDLKLFIIDPQGVDVLDKRDPRAGIRGPAEPLLETLGPRVIGASRRPLSAIFGADHVEHGKVMRFFQ